MMMKKIIAGLTVLLCLSSAHAGNGEVSRQQTEQWGARCQSEQHTDSCVQYGLWLRDIMESPASAVVPMRLACDGGNLKGCNILAGLYLNEYSGLGMDYRTAQTLYQRACRGGYRNACTNLESIDWRRLEAAAGSNASDRRRRLQQASRHEDEAACEALMREQQ